MNHSKHPRLALLLSLSFILSAGTSAEVSYDEIVIFGDSLSDTGNKYAETGTANTPPYTDLLDFFLVADGPYTRGGLHHSNGAVWAEQFARPLDLGGVVRPALRSEGKAMNYAYGGARARLEPPIIPNSNMHLPDQVSAFLADVNYNASANPLYVVFIGGNDVFDAIMALSTDSTGGLSTVVLGNAVTSVSTEIVKLYMAGARNFMVMNVPDLGVTPAMKVADAAFPGAIAAASFFTVQYNSGLGMALDVLENSTQAPILPGINIVRVDINKAIGDIIADPEHFGLINVTDTCVTPNTPPYACRHPDKYLFWDGVHPTKATHAILAAEVERALAD
ncbi:MAG TPA: GDSL family lipase [Gammaproteobacteria bacterium]|nr:GDSL family lipase [Gammaproteobacteria bacterium]